MITLTKAAQDMVANILAKESDGSAALRLSVQGGGCSGFSYSFALDDTQEEDDFVVPNDQFKFWVDAISMQYLTGSVVEYESTLTGGQFKVSNPNVTATCGCGSSFTMKE
jgi:iron-sulfur cluster assembly accessory protein